VCFLNITMTNSNNIRWVKHLARMRVMVGEITKEFWFECLKVSEHPHAHKGEHH
jgi:hypothetical protein